ncbi:hypothetical protein CSC70_11775 [Pseudoxanthomonas kalamensis DSM 18571]|uniref:hypothetical protein n=1 Tax=Pseudoxanthomonas kalamensis TaxID=289483 RepID=UPI0013914427|nr:hypothetical protein [Pseudoxanthomonas kalamensis]KAF1708786.1 hypothetical protein CSC70_11775 [Pseudoxanthomonas kalamensis DSM 18571]
MSSRLIAPALLTVTLALAGVATPVVAQTVGYNFRTGDAWVDLRLGEINDYGSHHRDSFVDEMYRHYDAPRSLVNELFGRHWSAGDIYYACAIASLLHLPCLDVVHEYERNPGQGWGALAKRMGIKPGSAEFHALKNGFVRSYDQWGHPVALDDHGRIDWSKPAHGKDNHSSHSGHSAGASGKTPPGQQKKQDKGKGKP